MFSLLVFFGVVDDLEKLLMQIVVLVAVTKRMSMRNAKEMAPEPSAGRGAILEVIPFRRG